MNFYFMAYFILGYTIVAIFLSVYFFLKLTAWLRQLETSETVEPEEPKTRVLSTETTFMGLVQTCDSPETVQKALTEGMNANKTNEDGFSPLMMAARFNKNIHVLFALLNAGAHVNDVDNHSRSALSWAAGNNANPMIIAALLESGANVNQPDNKGKTPLMYAAQFNPNPMVVATLLKSGADKTMRSDSGRTAYDYAHENTKLYKTPVFNQLSL